MPDEKIAASTAPATGRKQAEFSDNVKRTRAGEAGFVCANPSCCAPTIAAGSTSEEVGKVGEAAHISAAAKDFARWLPGMDPKERRSAKNGIWLCNTHAREIDVDEERHTIALLHSWKRRAKARALAARGKPKLWVPTGRSELIRTSRFLNLPVEQEEIARFVDQFVEDVGGSAFWTSDKLESVCFALYEIALNAMRHGGAKVLHLRSRGYRIDLVHDGSDFNPASLLMSDGRGGRESLRYLVELFGNALSIRYKYNGEVATIQLIDVSVAGPQHPCAVLLTPQWVDQYSGVIESCTVVHLFPRRRLSFSDSPELNISAVSAPPDTVYVLHDTNPRVIEHFRKEIPMLQAPGE